MADNNAARLIEIAAKEKEEFEKMAGILLRKQQAIGSLDMSAIQAIIAEELKEMNEIRLLEKERSGLIASLAVSGKDLNDAASMESHIGREESVRFRRIHVDFRAAVNEVCRLNGICQVLLLHSLEFIRQNIRILTDGGNRKLVDKKA